ncbi:DUF805 domain-containing protein [Yoonia sediminilitoris]|uniref:Uncharacterized membrane protein YhaH (DUF805 family) n=1 Tax=Yoonia sediminilitoris TaxID=1286148 RepID=A0A2T6KMN1_9RHOB|nr:DUF805 domain-containing protein [Yoonia sediminilitoris]PUB17482.1 uncharacterized membrane protein YhaH (DUF805 family) [Yoonia sediminilitoris]RCW97777.1 uncharacterized membrane protein YhaH (DUF805 family) [Yoonia sediminilitoris]
MTFSESVRTCLREKYATFSGRASRSEYWWYFLFIMLVYFALIIVMGVFGGATAAINPNMGNGDLENGLGMGMIISIILIGVFWLAVLLPSIAVVVRRLHDRNLSGWWYLGLILVGIVPIIGPIVSLVGGIVFFVIMCLKGTDGPNKYGADPLKGGEADIFS